MILYPGDNDCESTSRVRGVCITKHGEVRVTCDIPEKKEWEVTAEIYIRNGYQPPISELPFEDGE